MFIFKIFVITLMKQTSNKNQTKSYDVDGGG